MNKYEKLLNEADAISVSVDENYPFMGNTAGLYIDGNIALSDKLETVAEKACVLAEELGHHHTTVGNITNLDSTQNRKQERQARLWAYNRQLGLCRIVQAFEHGCQNRYEIAEFLEITEEFLEDAIECYREKYGIGIVLDNYYIMFIPSLVVGKII